MDVALLNENIKKLDISGQFSSVLHDENQGKLTKKAKPEQVKKSTKKPKKDIRKEAEAVDIASEPAKEKGLEVDKGDKGKEKEEVVKAKSSSKKKQKSNEVIQRQVYKVAENQSQPEISKDEDKISEESQAVYDDFYEDVYNNFKISLEKALNESDRQEIDTALKACRELTENHLHINDGTNGGPNIKREFEDLCKTYSKLAEGLPLLSPEFVSNKNSEVKHDVVKEANLSSSGKVDSSDGKSSDKKPSRFKRLKRALGFTSRVKPRSYRDEIVSRASSSGRFKESNQRQKERNINL